MELLHGDLTEKIIGAAFEVHRILGYGFLEAVYQKAMVVELECRGMRSPLNPEMRVQYKGVEVGFYKADLFVNQSVLVELKVAKQYNKDDEAQLLNELKATGVKVGMLINFGREKVEFKRMVF
jgi:GxxExxY protein